MPAAELAGRKAECFFLAWVLGDVHRCCLRSEFMRRVAAKRYGLAPLTRTSRRYDGSVGTMPLAAASAFVVPPLGASRLRDAWKGASPIHMGMIQSRREVILVSTVPQTLAGRAQLHGLDKQQRGVETSAWESAVLVPTRALSGNTSLAAMQSSVVD